MTLSQTSLLAYMSLDKLGERQQQVYDAFETLGSASNEQISEYLHLPIQSVTGRVNELYRYGYLNIEGLTKTRSGRTAKLWSVRSNNDKKVLDYARDCEG